MKISLHHKGFIIIILLHALYWALNVLFFTVYFSSREDFNDFLTMLLGNLAYLPGGMIFTYFSTEYLIPRYFFKKKMRIYLLFQVAVLLLYPVWSALVTINVNDPYVWHSNTDFKLATHLSTIIILIFDMVPLASVKISKRFTEEILARERLENDKVKANLKIKEAELKLLKAQVQPHFLFNTLNNIYSISITNPEKTPDAILKLAELLNYITYESVLEKVSLEKEAAFIASYIDLEILRYDDHLEIHKEFSGNFEGRYIAPMILHTFVENSFKHGASLDTGKPWINISLQINQNILTFEVSNSTIKETQTEITGIGIENVKKRLEYLYPERHSLVIKAEGNSFIVNLKLQL